MIFDTVNRINESLEKPLVIYVVNLKSRLNAASLKGVVQPVAVNSYLVYIAF